MEKVINEYLDFIGIKYSKIFLINLIKSNPNYPKEISVFDALNKIGLKYYACKLSKVKIYSLDFPFLIYLDAEEEFKFVKNKSDLDLLKEIGNDWEGIVVVITAEDNFILKNSDHYNTYKKERLFKFMLSLVLVCLFIVVIGSMFFGLERGFNTTVLLAFAGIVSSMFLQAKEFGVNSREIEQFCKGGKNLDCDLVTTSNYSRVFKNVSLTNVSTSYFAALLVSLVFVGYQQNLLLQLSSFLFYLFLANIPIVLWSLYIQYFKLKAWCKFCLIIDSVLVLLFIQYWFFNDEKMNFNSNIISPTVAFSFVFFLILLCILLVKNKSDDLKELEHNLNLSRRIVNSESVFKSYVYNQSYYDTECFENEISIGNIDNPIKILVVKNLYCKPCREHFYKIINLFQLFPNIYHITFRFKVSGKDIDKDPTTGEYLIQYWAQKIKGSNYQDIETIDFLMNWSKIRELGKFMESYPLKSDFKIGKEIDQRQLNWIVSAGIYRTPTTFFNGYILSPNYQVKDLISLTPELIGEKFLS